jgi:hypothetical protein
MADFEIDGHTYRTVKMNGREQFQLLRKLGHMAGLFSRFAVMDLPPNETLRMLAFVVAFMQEFSQLTEQQSNDLLTHCLIYTRRLVGGNGTGLAVPTPMYQGRDMFEDADMMVLMRICIEVVRENLGGFFPTGTVPEMSPPQPSTEPTFQTPP